MILCKYDGLLVSENVEIVLRNEVEKWFELKRVDYNTEDASWWISLEGSAWKLVLVWALSSSQFVKAAFNNVKSYLKD